MTSPNETKHTEQQSDNRNPTMPPTPTITITPSVDMARENQTQAENEVEVLTPATHTTGTEDHHSEQAQGSPDQVEASTTAIATPVGGINPQQQSPMGAATVAPRQFINMTLENYGADHDHGEGQADPDSGDAGDECGISPQQQSPMGVVTGTPAQWTNTTAENYGADDGHDKGQSDPDFDSSNAGDAGNEERSDSNSGDASDEQQSDSNSDDGDDEQQSGSDSGDNDGDEDEQSDCDSGDAGGGGEPGSDSGDADDEQQSGSDSGDSDDEEEEEGSGSDSGENGEKEEKKEEEAEEEEENMDVDDEMDATPTGINTDDGENNSLSTPESIEIDHRDAERSDPATPDLTSGSSDDDGPNIRTPVPDTSPGPQIRDGESSDGGEVAETTLVPMNIQGGMDVTMEDLRPARTPASTTSDDGDVNSDQTQTAASVGPEQAVEGNGGAVSSDVASEEDAPAPSHEDEDMRSDSEEDEVSGTSSLRGDAGESDMESSHGEEEIELTGSEGRLLPSEIPETPMRPRPGSQRNQDLGNTDIQQGEAVPSPEILMSRYPGYQRSEENSEDTQEPAAPSEQDSDDNASEDDWDSDYIEADHIQFPTEIPESPLRPAQRLGDDPGDFDLDEGEEVPNTVDRVALLTGYYRSEANDENDQADGDQVDGDQVAGHQVAGHQADGHQVDGHQEDEDQADGNQADGHQVDGHQADGHQTDEDQGGESSIEQQQSNEQSSDLSPNKPFSSNNPLGNPDPKDEKPIHLRIQYLVARSKRSKASLCLWLPANIPYPLFTRTIRNALQQHDGTRNPRPPHTEAVIARLLLFSAGRKKPIELTSENLQENLARVDQRSVYDFVKVEFVPGTNGEMRPGKASGKVNGRCGKVGGL